MARLDFLKKNSPFLVLRMPLDLGEFHPDLAENTVDVWQNPSKDFFERWTTYAAAIKEAAGDDPEGELPPALLVERNQLWAQLWDVSSEQVAALFTQAGAGMLVNWMRDRTWEIIGEFARQRGEAESD